MEVENENMISVIIPVYNAERFLNRCLDSICNSQAEVIIIDDGSTDKSLEICISYQKRYKNFTVIHQDNFGVSVARNAGIEVAQGNWICFVDADDYVASDWYDILISQVKKTPKADVIIFGKNIETKEYDQVECVKAALGDRSVISYGSESFGWPCSKLYSRKFLVKNDIRFISGLINGEDSLFNCEAFINAECIVGAKNSFYCVYRNMLSSTNSFNPLIIDTEIRFHERLVLIMKKYGLTDLYWLNLFNLTQLTGIYIVLYRIGLTKEMVHEEIILELIEREEYQKVLKKYDEYSNKMTKVQRFILKPLVDGNVKRSIYHAKSVGVIKSIYYKKKKNGLINYV